MTRILGIESSCDETAAAVVTDTREILSNVVYSDIASHQPYGGVVPEIAARSHMQFIEPVIENALKEADCALSDLDGIAVTAGPGLIGGVIVGVMAAKTLAMVANKPLIGVNHLEGHALTVRLTNDVPFPYLLLLVSGGHCQWLYVKGVGDYVRLGGTIDDALGEAFDKTAKMLGLPYPGGPQIESLAKRGNAAAFDLPRPLLDRTSCDFSFAGLKTAVRYKVQDAIARDGEVTEQTQRDMAACFQSASIDILTNRLKHALAACEELPPFEHVVLAGGVAANQAIRGAMDEACANAGKQLVVPPVKLCTDNAAMIAWAGMEHFMLGHTDELTLEPRARWPLAS